MSRDFRLVCATCSTNPADDWGEHSWGAGCDFNWCDVQLLALIPHFQLFAEVARAGFEIDPQSLDLRGSSFPTTTIGAFACAHVGHDVQVWCEYGRRAGDDG